MSDLWGLDGQIRRQETLVKSIIAFIMKPGRGKDKTASRGRVKNRHWSNEEQTEYHRQAENMRT